MFYFYLTLLARESRKGISLEVFLFISNPHAAITRTAQQQYCLDVMAMRCLDVPPGTDVKLAAID
jgi:hypothetical protein